MTKNVLSLAINSWEPTPGNNADAEVALENNQIIALPQLSFKLNAEERQLLNANILNGKRKNISYDKYSQKLGGLNPEFNADITKNVMRRFATQVEHLLHLLLPHYQDQLIPGRTSFRPACVEGRQSSSYRSDDTRLHVDAFPSTPMQNLRILRFFANINPSDEPRVWRIGEPFANLVARFQDQLRGPMPGSSKWLQWLHITRKYRTRYDHFMLQLHDKMKADMHYQQTAPQQTLELPAQTCWMVFTDSVSHAAMAGQFCLEQTFYLPIDAMQDSKQSPQHVLQHQLNQVLLT